MQSFSVILATVGTLVAAYFLFTLLLEWIFVVFDSSKQNPKSLSDFWELWNEGEERTINAFGPLGYMTFLFLLAVMALQGINLS